LLVKCTSKTAAIANGGLKIGWRPSFDVLGGPGANAQNC
jgi:hypothetical protein